MASAAFSINSTSVPQSTGVAVATTFGATVTLTLDDTTGASAIAWTILGVDSPNTSTPTISLSGTPLGSTATFTAGSDPGDGSGVSYHVRCRVTDGTGAIYDHYGVVGVKSAAGVVPFAHGEKESSRHPTMGWTVASNQMTLGFPHTAGTFTTTDATAATAATVAIPTGKIVRITASWSAVETSGGADRLMRESTAYFRNDSGVVTQKGSDIDVINDEDDASWAATFSIGSTNVLIRYQGDATNPCDWRIIVWASEPGN